jgi:LmbE family N-acetylglucosaminyl deacetylase
VYLFWTDSADHWEDITQSIEIRLSALARHASQVGLKMENLSERIRRFAREAGERSGCGYEYAEGFKRFQF